MFCNTHNINRIQIFIGRVEIRITPTNKSKNLSHFELHLLINLKIYRLVITPTNKSKNLSFSN